MQWLIDICKDAMTDTINALKAWVEAKGYLTTSHIDRGDPAAHDFIKANFTIDDNWHDLDLSGIIGEGAVGVSCNLNIRGIAIGNYAWFRKKGNANLFNISNNIVTSAMVLTTGDIDFLVDSDRKAEYKIHSNMNDIKLTVKKWWF